MDGPRHARLGATCNRARLLGASLRHATLDHASLVEADLAYA